MVAHVMAYTVVQCGAWNGTCNGMHLVLGLKAKKEKDPLLKRCVAAHRCSCTKNTAGGRPEDGGHVMEAMSPIQGKSTQKSMSQD
eukprot:1155386-Pelagomonas_calceolata.AAC.3